MASAAVEQAPDYPYDVEGAARAAQEAGQIDGRTAAIAAVVGKILVDVVAAGIVFGMAAAVTLIR